MRKFATLTALLTLMMTTLGVAAPGPAQAAGPRIVLIVMENKTYTKILGSSAAPYINSLIRDGKLFTDYHAVIRGSTRNYRAMTNGLTSGGATGPNLFRAMDQQGVAWKEFSESMTVNCGANGDEGKVPGTTWPLYYTAHDAARLYRSVDSCAKNDIPMTNNTWDPAELPAFSFVVPNMCDDMHTAPKGDPCPAFFGPVKGSGSIGVGDNWLKTVVPPLLNQPDVTVILTWDEGADSSHQHIVTLEVGAGVPAGSRDGATYNHYGLCAGLYEALNLGTPPNNCAQANALPIP